MSSDKITLTGATLMGDSTTSNSGGAGATATAAAGMALNNQHNHSHSHSHSPSHGHHQPSPEMEMSTMQGPSIDELLDSSTDEIVKSLSTLLRFGRYEALEPLLEKLVESKSEQLPDILSEMDDGGHSVLHWAAKRVDDIRFLNTLVEILVEYKLTPLLNAAR